MSSAVMTVSDVVSWLSGTSVRVAVTTIGGRLSIAVGSAAREKLGSKMKSRTTKTKTIILSFSRERGNVKQIGQVSWLGLQTYLPRLPTLEFPILDFRF